MEKLNEMKQNEKKIFLKFEIFYQNQINMASNQFFMTEQQS